VARGDQVFRAAIRGQHRVGKGQRGKFFDIHELKGAESRQRVS
jgi:hypothetical protein